MIFKVIPLAPELVSGAHNVEAESLETPWSEAAIAGMTGADGRIYLVALSEGETVGIAGAYAVCGELQITNIAVTASARGAGIGGALLDGLLAAAAENKCVSASLEVAENNTPAIALYRSRGFHEVGRRKRYYRGADALLFGKDL